jgi:hypothetical protein
MKNDQKPAPVLSKLLWGAGLLLLSTLWLDARAYSQDLRSVQLQDYTVGSVQEPVAGRTPSVVGHAEVLYRVAGFYDVGSVDVAIAAEEVCARYIRYKVRLRLPSGAYQSIAVVGPPGGFQFEVRDVTGDDVRNDLILTPALFPGLPTFLVNDGDDHFAVANSGSPGSLTAGEKVTRGAGDDQATAALAASGFAAGGHTKCAGLYVPKLRESLPISVSPTAASRLGLAPSSGRAPPLVTDIESESPQA